MGRTKEKLKVKITFECEYSYYGDKADIRDLEIFEKNLKDSIGETVYNSIENNLEDLQDLNNGEEIFGCETKYI